MEKKTEKVYQRVIDYIGCLIKDGKLKKGDKIPTERELSSRLSVSRNSIRDALKTLDVIGLVTRRQGDGTFIKHQFDGCLTEPLSLVFRLEEIDLEDILEFRNMVEVQTVALATERITDSEIEELERIYIHMSQEKDEVTRAKHDKDFHYLIAKSSKNVLVLNSYNVMSSLMDEFISDIRLKVLKHYGNEELVITVHKEILEAIKSRNPLVAEAAIKAHMQEINSFYSKFRVTN